MSKHKPRFTIENTGDGVWAVVDTEAKPGEPRHVSAHGTRTLARAEAASREPVGRPLRLRCEMLLHGCTEEHAETARYTVLKPFTLAGSYATGDRLVACPACARSIPEGFVRK